MNSQLLIGTHGWDHTHWSGAFYDPELPPEWRLTFYANLLRAVLVPESTGVKLNAALASAWFEDTDVGFRFVVEVSVGLAKQVSDDPAGLQRWLEGIGFLGGRVVAVLLRTSARDAHLTTVVLDRFCDAVSPLPVCVGPSDPPDGQEDCGAVWYPSRQAAQTVGHYLVVLSDTGDPAKLRRLIEWFIAQDLEGAALFMTDRRRGFEHAQQARLVAEMLGV